MSSTILPYPLQSRIVYQRDRNRFGNATRGDSSDTTVQGSSVPVLSEQHRSKPDLPEAVLPQTKTKSRFGITPSLRFSMGFILEDMVPPLLGFAFLGGPVGFALTVASAPLSYLSGKLGRRLTRDVTPEQLPGKMKNFHSLRESLKKPGGIVDAKDKSQLVNRWNTLVDDLLNIRESRLSGLLRFTANYLKVAPGGQNFISRVVNNPNFLKARVYHDISKADSAGKAMKAGVKGGAKFWWYHKALPKVGSFLQKVSNALPGPLKAIVNFIGRVFKDFGWFMMIKDALFPKEAAQPIR